ncbi:hypothetical protein V8E53_009717 [Lactarius tabidus]
MCSGQPQTGLPRLPRMGMGGAHSDRSQQALGWSPRVITVEADGVCAANVPVSKESDLSQYSPAPGVDGPSFGSTWRWGKRKPTASPQYFVACSHGRSGSVFQRDASQQVNLKLSSSLGERQHRMVAPQEKLGRSILEYMNDPWPGLPSSYSTCRNSANLRSSLTGATLPREDQLTIAQFFNTTVDGLTQQISMPFFDPLFKTKTTILTKIFIAAVAGDVRQDNPKTSPVWAPRSTPPKFLGLKGARNAPP